MSVTLAQRWRVRDSWPLLAPLTSAKGFGGFAAAKEAAGMPAAERHDHRDWGDGSATTASSGAAADAEADEAARQQRFEAALAAMDGTHRVSTAFYADLFAHYPQMQEIFWRFNLFQSLEKICAVLDPQRDLPAELRALAERHRGRGILNADYDRIRHSLHRTLHRAVAWNIGSFCAADADAWVAAWEVFAAAMKVDEPADAAVVVAPAANATTAAATAAADKPQERIITAEELARHATPASLWLAVEGNVYDLTAFLPLHPGGEMILLGAGKDATKLFLDNFHSARARRLLVAYHIGRFASGEEP